jgi:hypothetical protein
LDQMNSLFLPLERPFFSKPQLTLTGFHYILHTGFFIALHEVGIESRRAYYSSTSDPACLLPFSIRTAIFYDQSGMMGVLLGVCTDFEVCPIDINDSGKRNGDPKHKTTYHGRLLLPCMTVSSWRLCNDSMGIWRQAPGQTNFIMVRSMISKKGASTTAREVRTVLVEDSVYIRYHCFEVYTISMMVNWKRNQGLRSQAGNNCAISE